MRTEDKCIAEISINFMEACMANDVDKEASKFVWEELMDDIEVYQSDNNAFKALLSEHFSIDEYISIINYNPNIE